jgi:AAHS family 4-hydroxybenzoate transporter-like MFS transporter
LAQLALVRFAGGVVLGGIKPVIYSLNVESAPRRIRSSVVAIAYAGFSVGQIVSGLVMGSFVAPFSWRTLFIIGGVAPLLIALALLANLPESLRFIAKSQADGRPVPSSSKLASSLRALGVKRCGTGAVRLTASDEISPSPSFSRADPRQLFAGPLLYVTPLLWLVEILAVFVAGFFTYWTPTLARLLGASPAQASHALSAFALGAMVGPLLLTRLMDWLGREWVAIGPALAAAFLGCAGFGHLPDVGLLGVIFILGLLVLGVQMSLGSLFFQTYPTQIRTYAIGWVILLGGLGSVSSPMIAGRLIGGGASPATLFQITAAVMALAAPLSLILARTVERRVFCKTQP